METKIVYKAMRRVKGLHRSTLRSICPGERAGPYDLDYRMNRRRVAPKGTRIFAFDTLMHAKSFAETNNNHGLYVVAECLAEDVKVATHAPLEYAWRYGDMFQRYWNYVLNGLEGDGVLHHIRYNSFRGTVTCTAIMPKKVLIRDHEKVL